jgi:transcriptional regulator with XRE-family HTH domain
MATRGSPSIRARELGARLRKLRDDASLTAEAVAARLVVTPSKISRMETGQRPATLRDIKDLCELYQVDDELRDELTLLARQARERSWWKTYSDLGDVPLLVDYQEGASAITEYETSLVPGLLQTEEYARAAIRGYLPNIREEVLNERVEARLIRQKLLENEDPPRYRVLIDEAVLHRQTGGSQVLKRQLLRLGEVSRLRSHVSIQVIPFAAGAHPGMSSAFSLVEFPKESLTPIVAAESLAGSLFMDRAEDVKRYREASDDLRDKALNPAHSMTFITQIAEAL